MDELEERLAECRHMLRGHGEDFWADKIDSLLNSHLSPFYFAKQLLSWYGGMGSFNDIMLCPENHHRISPTDVEAVNERLRALQSSIYELARRAQRDPL